MAEELTEEQLALLANFMYSSFLLADSAREFNGHSIGAILDRIGTEMIFSDPCGGLSPEDWTALIGALQADEALTQLTLVNLRNDPAAGAPSAYFTSPDGQGIIACCGTGRDEWGYDLEGAFSADPPNKVALLRWFDSLNLDPTRPITITGHSDGGNDAIYLTVRRVLLSTQK